MDVVQKCCCQHINTKLPSLCVVLILPMPNPTRFGGLLNGCTHPCTRDSMQGTHVRACQGREFCLHTRQDIKHNPPQAQTLMPSKEGLICCSSGTQASYVRGIVACILDSLHQGSPVYWSSKMHGYHMCRALQAHAPQLQGAASIPDAGAIQQSTAAQCIAQGAATLVSWVPFKELKNWLSGLQNTQLANIQEGKHTTPQHWCLHARIKRCGVVLLPLPVRGP